MVDVLITIDTEVWPRTPDWRETRLSRDIARDIGGATHSGEFGVAYQIDVMNRYGVKAVFFLETMYSFAAGTDSLKRLVRLIEDRGHEVQLHLHTEWLSLLQPSPLPGRTGQHMKDFQVNDQAALIELGIRVLNECGVGDVRAFRAGNYGANLDTLKALARNGIRYDTSYNASYLDSDCDMREAGILLGPSVIDGVFEIPITFFEDSPGHYRHTQLGACSWGEMKHALLQAARTGRKTFVIVSHSFELTWDRWQTVRLPRPDRTVIRRFIRLCEFLAENRDMFRTRGFNDLNGCDTSLNGSATMLRSGMHRTVWRMAEQLKRRVL